MKILGIYKITYDDGLSQIKNLISHEEYLKTFELEYEKGKKLRKQLFGDYWFTDKSPLFLAISTGVLSLPSHQGGDTKCLIEKIN